jgi:hypothetical protein
MASSHIKPQVPLARMTQLSKIATHPMVFSVHGIVEDISDSRLTDAITCGFNLLFLP